MTNGETLNPKNRLQMDVGVTYGSMAGFDAWNVFVWTFEEKKSGRAGTRARRGPAPGDMPAIFIVGVSG